MEINEIPLTMCQFPRLRSFDKRRVDMMVSGRRIA